MSVRDWEELDAKLSDLRRRSKESTDKLSELTSGKSRLERLSAALPLVANLKERKHRRAALDPVKLLRQDFSEDRGEARRERAKGRDDEASTRGKIARAERSLKDLSIPMDLLAQEKTVQEFVQESGAVRKARRDLPQVRGQVNEALQSSRSILMELRPDLTLETAGELRLTVQKRETIRGLADECTKLMQAQEVASKSVEEQADELAGAQKELAALRVPKDVDRLKSVVASVRRKGDLEGSYSDTLVELEDAKRAAETSLKTLSLWSGTLEAVATLPVAQDETIDEYEAAFKRIEGQAERASETREKAIATIQRIDGEIETLLLTGDIPTEADLADSRQRRDRGWMLVCTEWLDGTRDQVAETEFDPDHPLAEAYEKSVLDADDVADRLRRQADRVARKAELLAQRKREDLRGTELADRLAGLQLERASLQVAWVDVWRPCGIAPLSPREMRAWRQRQQDLARVAGGIRKSQVAADRLEAEVRASREAILEQLRASAIPLAALGPSLEDLLECAEGVVHSEQHLTARREGLVRRIADAGKMLDKAKDQERKATLALAERGKSWTEAVRGISDSLRVSGATRFLDKCSELSKKLDEAEKDKRRIDAMQHDIGEFEKAVVEFMARIAPDLATIPAEQAVQELSARISKAKADDATRIQLEKQLVELKVDLQEAVETIRRASARLLELVEEAGCSTEEDLPAVEAASDAARGLDAEIGDLEARIRVLALGKSLKEFLSDAEKEDPEKVTAGLVALESHVAEQQEILNRFNQDIGASQQKLTAMDGRATAADHAQAAQERLAELREKVRRYLRLRLARRVLQVEIDRYREKHQGPVLKRASEIFATVTADRFVALEPNYDSGDEPVLVGNRRDGPPVPLSGMSDGTQDQLYFALRLATLENHLAENEPLPLIVDDAFVNFDNDRASASLKVLQELASKTQVMFFTHHKHLVELARKTVAERVLHVQDLDVPSSSGSAQTG